MGYYVIKGPDGQNLYMGMYADAPCWFESRVGADRFDSVKEAKEHLQRHSYLRDRARVVHVGRRSNCTVHTAPCPEHGFVHGAEANELREAIESILKDFRDTTTGSAEEDLSDILEDLEHLLQKIDARDSVAHLEAKRESERGIKP